MSSWKFPQRCNSMQRMNGWINPFGRGLPCIGSVQIKFYFILPPSQEARTFLVPSDDAREHLLHGLLRVTRFECMSDGDEGTAGS